MREAMSETVSEVRWMIIIKDCMDKSVTLLRTDRTISTDCGSDCKVAGFSKRAPFVETLFWACRTLSLQTSPAWAMPVWRPWN